MGAKTWMLAYSDGNVANTLKTRCLLDKEKTLRAIHELFPNVKLEALQDGDLSCTCPPNREIYAGYFDDVFIVAAKEFGIDYPSKIASSFLKHDLGSTIYLHAMHSVVDWFAYAIWESGKLVRSLSLSPDSGVLEDIGEKQSFELPYWNGDYPAVEPDEEYPFPFHPLDLGEAALKEYFGYILEGEYDSLLVDPEDIPLARYKRIKPFWKLWY